MKQNINLSDHLPKNTPPFLTSLLAIKLYSTFLLALVIVSLSLGIYNFFLNRHIKKLSSGYTTLELQRGKVDPLTFSNETAILTNKVTLLQTQIQKKQTLLNQVKQEPLNNVAIFTQQFSVLGEVNMPQIQITSLLLAKDGKAVTLSGLTTSALSLTRFMTRLKSYQAFSDIYFSRISLNSTSNNTDTLRPNLLNFSLTSREAETNATNNPR
ncbi:MAG: PilN domain-containing protein [Gammaproteobacteria bacterium]|nr:PilN domain-containing protein [Gammaproteobacteria bacterium]